MVSERNWLTHFPSIAPAWWEETARLLAEAPRPRTFYSFVPSERGGLPYMHASLHQIIGHLDAGNLLVETEDGNLQDISLSNVQASADGNPDAMTLAKWLTRLVSDDTAWEDAPASLASYHLLETILKRLHQAWCSLHSVSGT